MAFYSDTPQALQPGFALQDGSAINAALAAGGESVASGIVATGTTLASAFALKAAINQVATAAASTGVALSDLAPGYSQTVFNAGVSTLTVYAPNGITIDTVAGATGVPLSAAARCRYTCVAPGVVISALLGAVSA
jgi:hypothetical protein